jgi:hypothetical protein
VRYGQQSWEEMMIGFFDVAVALNIDKKSFFAGQVGDRPTLLKGQRYLRAGLPVH